MTHMRGVEKNARVHIPPPLQHALMIAHFMGHWFAPTDDPAGGAAGYARAPPIEPMEERGMLPSVRLGERDRRSELHPARLFGDPDDGFDIANMDAEGWRTRDLIPQRTMIKRRAVIPPPREPHMQRMRVSEMEDGTVCGVVVFAQDNEVRFVYLPDDAHCKNVARWFSAHEYAPDAQVSGMVYIVFHHKLIPCMIPPGSTCIQAGVYIATTEKELHNVVLDTQKQDELLKLEILRGTDITSKLLETVQWGVCIPADDRPITKERMDLAQGWREYAVMEHDVEKKEQQLKMKRVAVDEHQVTFINSRRAWIGEQLALDHARTLRDTEHCRLAELELVVARHGIPPAPPITKATNIHCVVCMTNERGVMLVPCNHVCVCRGCWDKWNQRHRLHTPCPVCRTKVTSSIDVHL